MSMDAIRDDAACRFDPQGVTVGLADFLRGRAASTDSARRMTEDVFAELDGRGLFQLLTPRKYGGAELGLPAYMDILTEIGRGDMSSAWVVNIINVSNWGAAVMLPQAVADRVFATPGGARIAGVFEPRKLSSRIEAGEVVIEDGIWGFNSGVHVSNWDMLGVPDADGGLNLALLPTEEVEILDDWDVTGMRGSGSNSVRVRGRRIAPEMMAPFGKARAEGYVSPNLRDASLYRVSYAGIGSIILTLPTIGAGLAAIDLFVEKAQGRGIAYTSYSRQADSAVIQAKLAMASAKVDAARTIARATLQLLQDRAEGDLPLTPLESARIRRDAGFICTLVSEAVDLLAGASGGSLIAASNTLNRIWRDVRGGTLHGAITADTTMESYGRQVFGLGSLMTLAGTR